MKLSKGILTRILVAGSTCVYSLALVSWYANEGYYSSARVSLFHH